MKYLYMVGHTHKHVQTDPLGTWSSHLKDIHKYLYYFVAAVILIIWKYLHLLTNNETIFWRDTTYICSIPKGILWCAQFWYTLVKLGMRSHHQTTFYAFQCRSNKRQWTLWKCVSSFGSIHSCQLRVQFSYADINQKYIFHKWVAQKNPLIKTYSWQMSKLVSKGSKLFKHYFPYYKLLLLI